MGPFELVLIAAAVLVVYIIARAVWIFIKSAVSAGVKDAQRRQ